MRAIGAFCDEHGIDAWFRADGDINAAASAAQVGAWADLIVTADRIGRSADFEVLSGDQMRARVDPPRSWVE